ncbi:MAG: TonB-dependent receptor [Bacteroidales bacterium]|nr:TonB-dependent receptor [Bacteroidales bacterium]
MNRKLLILLFFACCCMGSFAQNTVKGVLYDDKNGEAIPFANIMLEGTSYGATTDINGFFLINKVPDGTYTLLARYVGYEEFRKEVVLAKKNVVSVTIQIKPTATMMKEVVITENKVEERKNLTQVSVEKISASQIKQMPSIGGQADLAQYLQVLPGVNSTGDQGGQLYIRGGSMIQNLCLLDGMIVYNPFHSIGLYSIFETDLILNADIYTGGFGAKYGGRLSSVMDITTRDGNKKRHSGKVGLNTFGASLLMEGPLKKEKGDDRSTITYVVSAKNSYLSKTSEIIYPYVGGGLPFDYTDLYGKLSVNSGTGSKANFFGFRYDDQVSNYQSLADYHWNNYGVGGNFVLATGSSTVVEGSLAYSNYRINMNDASGADKYSSIGGFNMTFDIANFYGKNKLTYGLSFEGYATDYKFTNDFGISKSQAENITNFSLFGAYNVHLDKWLLDPGVRIVNYTSLSETSVEPRLAAKFNATDNLRFKFAGGLYSQVFLDARSDADIVNLFSGFLTGSGALNCASTFMGQPKEGCVQHAQHVILGAEYDITTFWNVNAELYFKNFSQLLNSNHNQMYDENDPAYAPGGAYEKPEYFLKDFIYEKGKAYGLDISSCYDFGPLYIWATYSLGWVSRTDDVRTYSPHYDRRHTVNLMATYTLGEDHDWEISGRWSFGSGFPFTQTQGAYEQISFAGGVNTDYTTGAGQLGLHYGEIYGGRLPSYHRLDLGAKRKIVLGKHTMLEISLSMTNVYSRQNIFYFDRVTFDRVNQLPFMACLGANLHF